MYSIIESLRFWIPFVIVFWLLGYFSTRLSAGTQLVNTPIWFFYFCGAPKTNGLAKSQLTRLGAGLQLIALFQLIFALFFDFLFEDKELSGLVGLWSSLIGSLVVTRILVHRSSQDLF
jgi:hypothetical protein